MALKALVQIEAGLRNGRTALNRLFYQPPFKLADVTEDRRSKELRLMLMSSSPGVLDGDAYDFEIDVAEDCSLRLETQSYTRLFQMKDCATQRMTVRVQRGGSFAWLPHPTVPHCGSAFRSRSRIYLSDDCSLLWAEVLSAGRTANGERFQFSMYRNTTEIFLNEKLAVKENLFLKPGAMNPAAMGQLEGYTHTATLLFVNPNVDASLLRQRLVDTLSEYTNLSFGVSALPVNGVAVRVLGYKAEILYGITQRLAAIIQYQLHSLNADVR